MGPDPNRPFLRRVFRKVGGYLSFRKDGMKYKTLKSNKSSASTIAQAGINEWWCVLRDGNAGDECGCGQYKTAFLTFLAAASGRDAGAGAGCSAINQQRKERA